MSKTEAPATTPRSASYFRERGAARGAPCHVAKHADDTLLARGLDGVPERCPSGARAEQIGLQVAAGVAQSSVAVYDTFCNKFIPRGGRAPWTRPAECRHRPNFLQFPQSHGEICPCHDVADNLFLVEEVYRPRSEVNEHRTAGWPLAVSPARQTPDGPAGRQITLRDARFLIPRR